MRGLQTGQGRLWIKDWGAAHLPGLKSCQMWQIRSWGGGTVWQIAGGESLGGGAGCGPFAGSSGEACLQPGGFSGATVMLADIRSASTWRL